MERETTHLDELERAREARDDAAGDASGNERDDADVGQGAGGEELAVVEKVLGSRVDGERGRSCIRRVRK